MWVTVCAQLTKRIWSSEHEKKRTKEQAGQDIWKRFVIKSWKTESLHYTNVYIDAKPRLAKLEKKEWLRQFESNRVGESLGHGVLSCPVPTLRTVTASPCRFGQVQRARGAAGQGAGGPWDHLLGHRVSSSWGPCCLLCTLCVHLGAACVEGSVRPKHAAESSVCGGEPSTPCIFSHIPANAGPAFMASS